MLLSLIMLGKEHNMNENFFLIHISDFKETVHSIMSANTNCVISKYKSVL